ncbi:MAG: TauD/TfdA family dioxygenase [Burkholderiaceae bacterium]
MKVTPSGASCGAVVEDIDLRELDDAGLERLRGVWLEHKVIGIAGQSLQIEDLERFAQRWGPFGDDPFILPIAGHPHVIEVRREPDERAPVFAGNWHSDWSFLASPPAATLLYGEIVPDRGGDTLFADLEAALAALPAAQREQLASLTAIHSARRSYAPDGRYGVADEGRSMRIVSSDDARAQQRHPLVRTHPETGHQALFVSPAYTVGLADTGNEQADEILRPLFEHCGQDRFVYRHSWSPGMLTIWDNRCLNHMATGGYEGQRRLLYRITIGDRTAP